MGPSFCPGCGAPLRLSEEPTPRPLDGPVSLDRRGAPHALDDTLSGATPRPSPAAAPARPPAPTRRSELADVERSHWELGKAPGDEARTRTPAPGPSPASGPDTWSGTSRAAGASPSSPPAPAREVLLPPDREPIPPPAPPRRAPVPPPAPRTAPGGQAPPPASRLPAPPPAAPRPGGTASAPATRPPAAPRPAPAPPLEPEAHVEDWVPDAEIGLVEVRVRRAEGWRRALAWAVDGLPFALGGAMTSRWVLREAAVHPAAPRPEGLLDLVAREPAIVASIAAAVVLALAVYGTLAHFLAGATLGKRLLGVRVVGPDGRRPSLGRSAVRSVLAIASAGLLGLGFLLALFNRSGRALHDLLARTWVVRAP